jgi:hypothetical protein
MWWDYLKQSKHLYEKNISRGLFKGYFQDKYLSDHYYERNMKDFFQLMLGSMTMDEYEKRFFELPSFYSDKIHYYNQGTLEEVTRR